MTTYTDKILDAVDDGSIDRNELILALLKFMGENDVKMFYHENLFKADLSHDEQRAWYDTSAELL